jgi:DNA-3-methyladenine glycosylase
VTPGPVQPLPRAFYDRDVLVVARELIGCLLRHCTADGAELAGRIVETEAYRHDDAASHAYKGPTDRNTSMFGAAGNAYVYFIYGMYDCFNVVCGPPGVADAVLIRAIEPTHGMAAMFLNRFGTGIPMAGNSTGPGPRQLTELASGPGKLCQALQIARSEVDGSSLESGPVTIHPAQTPVGEIVTARRIGISRAVDLEWRFLESGNRFVSRPVPGP